MRTGSPPHATATITYTETFSALRRRVRESVLGAPEYDEIVRRFLQDWPTYVRMNLDEVVLARSKALLERYPLRTLDAIHLASAIEITELHGVGEHRTPKGDAQYKIRPLLEPQSKT